MENDNELLIAATDFFISEVKREFKSAKPEFIKPYLDYFNIWKEGLLQGKTVEEISKTMF